MSATVADVVAQVFRRFEQRDPPGVVDLFADDGVFIDPHYPPPIGPVMVGREAIRAGIDWAFTVLEQPSFSVRNLLVGVDGLRGLNAVDGAATGAVEVRSSHRLVGGIVMDEEQIFVAELDPTGKLQRLQSYSTYPPPLPPPPVGS